MTPSPYWQHVHAVEATLPSEGPLYLTDMRTGTVVAVPNKRVAAERLIDPNGALRLATATEIAAYHAAAVRHAEIQRAKTARAGGALLCVAFVSEEKNGK